MGRKRRISRRGFLGGSASVGAALSVSALAPDTAESRQVSGARFRVLSLDGGGARGYLTAGILANIEAYLDQVSGNSVPLGQRFDLIAGTSTGGIIGLGLALGITAREIRAFYEQLLPAIFAASEQASLPFRLLSPKYKKAKLTKALQVRFGDATLADVKTDVCITAVALQSGKPRFHKSDYRDLYKSRLDEKLVDVALATASAPTYFAAHNLKHSQYLIDGGICANNPSMVALVEAVRFGRNSKRGTPPAKDVARDVLLLSVGTGEQPSMPYDATDLSDSGLINWATYISEVMFQSQSDVTHVQCAFLLGANYLRINPLLKSPIALDDVSKLPLLRNLIDIGHHHEDFLLTTFVGTT